jgi:hypothetical protein
MHLPLSTSSRVKAIPNSSREAPGSATTITILSPATVTFTDCFECYLPFFVDSGASTHEFIDRTFNGLRAWLMASDLSWGGDVLERGNAGSPGSGGTSPEPHPYPELRSCSGASSVCSKIAHKEEQELKTELILVIGSRNVLCGARQQFG